MSHYSTCGHCGTEYDGDLDHVCDVEDAFDRVADLEEELKKTNFHIAKLDAALRRMCALLGLNDEGIARVMADP